MLELRARDSGLMAEPVLLAARAAAAYLGVGVRTIYTLPIPRYTLGPRLVRWKREDLDGYIEACRSTSTSVRSAGGSISTASLEDSDAALLSSFRRLGIAIKPKPSTAPKPGGSTPLRLVSKNQP